MSSKNHSLPFPAMISLLVGSLFSILFQMETNEFPKWKPTKKNISSFVEKETLHCIPYRTDNGEKYILNFFSKRWIHFRKVDSYTRNGDFYFVKTFFYKSSFKFKKFNSMFSSAVSTTTYVTLGTYSRFKNDQVKLLRR